jgi:hypothetical protein
VNPGGYLPPGISLEDLITKAKEQIKTDTDGSEI